MKFPKKKSFFRRPTSAKIKKQYNVREIGNSFIVKNLLSLRDNEFLLLRKDLIKLSFPKPKEFQKKATRLNVGNIEDLARQQIVPVGARNDVFDNLRYTLYGGFMYSSDNFFVPNLEVSLVDCVEGTKLFCYANRDLKGCCVPRITVKPYADISKEAGAAYIVSVPSRTQGKRKYNFKYDNIPVVDNDMKFNLAFIAGTNHSCEEKNYDIRRSNKLKKYLRYHTFCPHEIAAYLQIIKNNIDDKNQVPLQMSLFAIPTQLVVDIYTLASQKALIDDQGDIRLLEKGELERILWLTIKDYGNDQTFFAKNKLSGYNWNVNNIAPRE